MTTVVRETRTPNEVEAQCASAREDLDHPARYARTKARAVLGALAWVTGKGPAPITGGQVEPTEDAILDECRQAEWAEERALLTGLDGTHPGQIGVVLSWYHHDPDTEAPY